MKTHRSRTLRWSLGLLLGALLFTFSLAGCGSTGSAGPLLAASVNGHPIALTTYQHLLGAFKASAERQNTPTDWQSPDGRTGFASAQTNTLNFLINLELMREQVDRLHLSVSSADVAKAKQQLTDSIGAAVKQNPNDAGLHTLANSLTDDVLQVLAEQEVAQTVLMKSTKLVVPTAHIRVIVVNTKADATGLQQQVEHGADFAALAKAHSIDTTTAAQGGEFGIVYLGQVTSDFDAAVLLTKSNVKYAVVPVSGKYALVEITQRTQKSLTALSDAQAQQSVFDAWLSEVILPQADVQRYVTAG